MLKLNQKSSLSSQTGFSQILILILIVLGVVLGVFLVNQKTNILPKASTPTLVPPFLSLSPDTGNFNAGCNLSLNLDMDTFTFSTDGVDAVLHFDPAKLQVVSVTPGNTYAQFPGNQIDNQNGKVIISGLASLNSPFTGKGTLATVNFVLSSSASGSTQVTFDFDPNNKTKTTDSNMVETGVSVDVLNAVGDGSYNIGTGSCNESSPAPTPTPLATINPTPAPSVSSQDSDKDGFSDKTESLIGTNPQIACSRNRSEAAWPPDLDNNKIVNNIDYQTLSSALKRYDLNTDGRVDKADLDLLNSKLGQSCNGRK